MVSLPVEPVEIRVDGEGPRIDRCPFTLPIVRSLLDRGLDLGPATVLVGENGSGKSTLVEGLALPSGSRRRAARPAPGTAPASRSRRCGGGCGFAAASERHAGGSSSALRPRRTGVGAL